jgi:hypothetical protein
MHTGVELLRARNVLYSPPVGVLGVLTRVLGVLTKGTHTGAYAGYSEHSQRGLPRFIGAQVSSVALLYEDAAATKDWCVAAHVLGYPHIDRSVVLRLDVGYTPPMYLYIGYDPLLYRL